MLKKIPCDFYASLHKCHMQNKKALSDKKRITDLSCMFVHPFKCAKGSISGKNQNYGVHGGTIFPSIVQIVSVVDENRHVDSRMDGCGQANERT